MKSQNILFHFIKYILAAFLIGCRGGSGLKSINQRGTDNVEDINPFDYGDEFTQQDFNRKIVSEADQAENVITNKNSKTIKSSLSKRLNLLP